MDALTNALSLIAALSNERAQLKHDYDECHESNGRLFKQTVMLETQLAQAEDERRRLSAALAEAQRQIAAVQASAKAQTPAWFERLEKLGERPTPNVLPESFDDLIASAEAIAEVYAFDPGKKISIIRDLKLARGIGLREAKEAVETVFLRR